MRRWSVAAWGAIVCASASLAMAQNESPDQLRRMYTDTLHQLQEAQDRKNQLAAENDKLNARLADLQKQLDAARAALQDNQRQSADFAGRTFDLRAQTGAWQAFISHDPVLQRRWERFLEDSAVAGVAAGGSDDIGADWPWLNGR